MSEVPYFEFNDSDDPESNSHPSHKEKMSFKISVEPQMYLVAMIEKDHVKMLPPDTLRAVGQLMKAAYEQGKRVGAFQREGTGDEQSKLHSQSG